MKNLLTIILLSIVIICQAQSDLLKQKVSLHVVMTPLDTIMTDLSVRYNVSFSYGRDNIDLHEKVSIKRAGIPMDSLLTELLSPAHITYAVIGDQIVLRKELQSKIVDRSNLQTFSGMVVDRSTGGPLPHATISIRGKSTGTISNIIGEFALVFTPRHDTLHVSYIGYESMNILTDSIENVYTRIALRPVQTVLKAVEVAPLDPMAILQKALASIPQNYSMQPFRQQFYMRDRTWMDGEAIKASESIYQSYRGDLSGADYHRQLKLIEGRKSVYNKRYYEVMAALPMLSSFDVGVNPYFIFTADLPKYVSHDVFFGKGNLKHYTFELGDNTSYDGHEVYVLHFDQKSGNKSLLKGKLYIHTETYAIIHISQSLSPKGLSKAEIFGPRVMEKIFGLGENVMIGVDQEFHFRAVNGKWFADHVNHKVEMSLIKKKRGFNANIVSESNLVVTAIKTDGVIPFSEQEVADSKALSYRQYGDYHEAFWADQNIIKPDPEFESSFYRIEASNDKKERAFDDQIWDRINRKKKGHQKNILPDSTQVSTVLAAAETDENKTADWNESELDQKRKTTRFTIHFNNRDSGVVDSVLTRLNKHYDRILSAYSIRKLPRIDAYIYPSLEDYHGAINYPNAPAWMVGSATIDKFSIVSPLNPGPAHTYDDVLNGVVHEFMHCVHIHLLRNNMGKARDNEARWLWEGLACFEGNQFVDPKTLPYIVNGNFPTLEELNSSSQGEKIYELGYTLIDFIEKTWGRKRLLKLMKSNADIEGVLDISEKEFEKRYNAYLQATYL